MNTAPTVSKAGGRRIPGRFSEFCPLLGEGPERFRRYVASPVLVVSVSTQVIRRRPADPFTTTVESKRSINANPLAFYCAPPATTRVVMPLRQKAQEPPRRLFHVGRGMPCDVVLAFESVSRLHAFIEQDAEGNYFVRDAQSKNGTYLNGERIPPNVPMELGEEAHIIFGEVEAEFLVADSFRMELSALASRLRVVR